MDTSCKSTPQGVKRDTHYTVCIPHHTHILHFFTLLGGINLISLQYIAGGGQGYTLNVVAMVFNPHVRKKYRNFGITVTPASAFFCKVTVSARHRHSGIRVSPVPLVTDNFGIA
jgi:hypothetical protein